MTVVLKNISATHHIEVTFSSTSDDSGIPDKYKHIVSATSGEGGSVDPKSQKVVDGGSAVIDITPDANMAVDEISTNSETYVNDGK